jgi:4-amino-4-deoxy-L-arabinose transferase-like glycosyltransferase
MILMGYGGLGFAVLLTGLIGMASVVEPARVMTADFVYYHALVLLFLMIGIRHLFSFPIEPKANWIFRITEGEGRGVWLHAMDRFVLFWGAMFMIVIPFPLEVRLLGWRGIEEAVLFLALGLLTYEWVFSSWDKLPFACSYLPGKTPVWMILAFFGLIGAVALLQSLLLAILYNGAAFVVVLAALLAAWTRIRSVRRQGWTGRRLKYDDVPEPVVHGLNLLR